MDERQVLRGDIYYILAGTTPETGSEQRAGRPAVIVSSNFGNAKSGNVSIVYLTTQEKRTMRTHVSVMGEKPSTAICEQPVTVSRSRLGAYVRHCDAFEMREIDAALKTALALYDDTSADFTAQEMRDIKKALCAFMRVLHE